MATDTTHPSLLARVRDAADAEAWRQFDVRYGPLVLGYCRARGLQLCDAEDVRQMVMLGLARGLSRFTYDPARGRFRDYLARVVRNAVARHTRRHAGHAATLSNDELEALGRGDAARGEDAEWERQWAQHHCRQALAALRQTESPRNVAMLERLLAGTETAAVATEFGLTAEALRKVKQRLRERLRAIVLTQLTDEERTRVGAG